MTCPHWWPQVRVGEGGVAGLTAEGAGVAVHLYLADQAGEGGVRGQPHLTVRSGGGQKYLGLTVLTAVAHISFTGQLQLSLEVVDSPEENPA